MNQHDSGSGSAAAQPKPGRLSNCGDAFDSPLNIRPNPVLQAEDDFGCTQPFISGFETEAASVAALDDLISAYPHAFMPLSEVTGTILHPRTSTECGAVRIDRILVPKCQLIDAGWTLGPIGIEAKRSSEKGLGRAVAQAMDYSRAAFQLPASMGHISIILSWIFIWPLRHMFGDIASVAAQNRIGHARPDRSGGIVFGSGGVNLIKINSAGLACKSPATGNKVGNRGAAR